MNCSFCYGAVNIRLMSSTSLPALRIASPLPSPIASPPASPETFPKASPIFPFFNDALLITPINKNTKSKSNIDYQEQDTRKKEKLPLCWDDSKHNATCVGDLFGYWHHKRGVEIHQVLSVHSPKNRLASWSNNVGQTNRHILMLSPLLLTIPWEIWEDKLNGSKRCMGTASVKRNIGGIINYIKLNLSNKM